MTPIILVDELKKFIEPLVANYELETNTPPLKKSPQVITGFLPEKKPHEHQNPPDFPFVIVRYLDDDEKVANIRIIVGTYSEDYQDGWRDCLNVATRIRDNLLKFRIIGKCFRVEKTKLELPEEQPYPEWAAFLTVNILLPEITEEGGFLKDVLG